MLNSFSFFFFAVFIRILFLLLQNPLPENLIEDELLYWQGALSYLEKGYLENSIKTERMSGVFIYLKILLLISFKNLKALLILQSIIDALTCVVIYKTGKMIFPKQQFYIGLSAIFSPLMIIISAQVLSDTIFLFFFSLFLYFSLKVILSNNKLFFNIALSGLLLGLSTSIRSITYPLIFLSLLPFVVILVRKKIFRYKISFVCIVFLFFSILPISLRLFNNIQNHNSYSLTNQTGIHLAYWVIPTMLTETLNISRKEALEIVNKERNKYIFTNDPYKNDKLLRKVSYEVLSNIEKTDIFIQWCKGAIINLTAPSIFLNKDLRALPHPSFYETGNLLEWLRLLATKSEYFNYFIIIILSSITSLFTIASLIIGPLFIFKENKVLFFLTLLYLLYFLLITGPVLSPKYIFPILPCIFLYQGITIYKISDKLKHLKYFNSLKD